MTAQQNSRPQARLDAPATASDDELVDRVRHGDASAFELIMRRHNQRLYRLARSIVRNPAEAAEAVQDAYVQAYEKLAFYRGPASFAAWLGRIALNKAMDRARERGRVISLDACLAPRATGDGRMSAEVVTPQQLASRSPDPEQLAASSDIRRLIEQAVDALPDEFRSVFMLRAVEGLPVEEVAQQLDLPAATVRTRYHRARQRLRQALGDRLELTVPAAFPFAGERCDGIVAEVLARLPGLAQREPGETQPKTNSTGE